MLQVCGRPVEHAGPLSIRCRVFGRVGHSFAVFVALWAAVHESTTCHSSICSGDILHASSLCPQEEMLTPISYSLVGICSEQKLNVMANVVKSMRPGALLVLRTSHSLRSLMYPVRINRCFILSESLSDTVQFVPVSLMCSAGITPLLVVHPHNHVINSAIICRVNPACTDRI